MATKAGDSTKSPMAGRAAIDLHYPLNKLLLTERFRRRFVGERAFGGGQPLIARRPSQSADEVDRLPRKLRVYWYSVFFSIISALTYLADIGTDLFVGIFHFSQCRYLEGSLVLVLAFVSSLFVNILGYLWVMDDLNKLPKNRVTNRLKVPVWIVGLVTQTIPALYCFESAYYSWTFRRMLAASNGVVDARMLELYYWIIESDRDSTLLRVFIAFMESAPQLLIQAYVLCKELFAENGSPLDSFYAWVHYISISVSLFGLAWSLMSQQRSLRYVRQDKENLGVRQCFMILAWRTFTLIGRFIALIWFILAFGYWLVVLLSLQYLLTLAFISIEQPKLAESSCQQCLLLMGVCWVHLFSPWNVAEGQTRYRYLWRYGFELFEAGVVVCFVLKHPQASYFHNTFEPAIVLASCYLVGLVIMGVYYGCCHPNLTTARRLFPPLVVVYTPPDKVTTVTPPTPDAVIVLAEAEGEEDDVSCCGGGRRRSRVGRLSGGKAVNNLDADGDCGGCCGGGEQQSSRQVQSARSQGPLAGDYVHRAGPVAAHSAPGRRRYRGGVVAAGSAGHCYSGYGGAGFDGGGRFEGGGSCDDRAGTDAGGGGADGGGVCDTGGGGGGVGGGVCDSGGGGGGDCGGGGGGDGGGDEGGGGGE